MPISRRTLLSGTAAVTSLASIGRLGHAQAAASTGLPQPAPTDYGPLPTPLTPAAQSLYAGLGAPAWADLCHHIADVNSDIRNHGMRPIAGVPGSFLTGYPNNEFYDWDLYFENIYLSYYNVWPWCFTNLKEFLNRQQPDGYISRSLINKRDRQHFKPFLAQLVVLGVRQNNNDFSWLRGNYYDRLSKYLVKWFSYDSDGNGLPVWNSADAAGNDNQWSRGGVLASFTIEGVDLASYLVRELRAMSVIASALGHTADATGYTQHADQLIQLINTILWDEKEGMYFDRNEKTGERVFVKSATSFTPLFAGAATPERAERTIREHLVNPREFWLDYPVASYARTEPDYYQGARITYAIHRECNWRGPTWAPTNYMIFQGLRRYGYHDIARDLAARLLRMAAVENPALREYYNAETGEGLGKTTFWGFTDLYYGMLLESYLDYDASSLEQPILPIIPQNFGIHFPDPPRT